MQNPRLATRYAKSLMGLALEQNQLEAVHNDMQFLQGVCRSNRDFQNLLRSPIIKSDVKQKIVNAVTDGKIGMLSAAFTRLLMNKGRESNLPEIAASFISEYKNLKGIIPVKLTTAAPVSDEVKAAIVSKLPVEGKQIELESVVDESIIGGFILKTGDNLVDASISYDLRAIKKQFMNNDFIYKIR
jgi:F-type H+-transporting ATPase subunit delta